MYRLINALPSPFGRKVAISMKEKGIPYEVSYDVPWADGTCVPEFNPLEQLPILITETGETIYESTYILEWLERRHPTPPLVPSDTDGILAVKKLQVLAEGVIDAAVRLVFELQRPEPSESWVARQRRKIGGGTAELARLTGDKRYAVADRFTLADIAATVNLTMLEFMIEQGVLAGVEEAHWRARHPDLARYTAEHEQRPSFRETRPVMFELKLDEVVA